MTFTFEDAEGVCRRLRDKGGEDTRKLAHLLATCVDIGSWAEGIEDAMDAQVDEEALSREMLDTALADLAETIEPLLNKLADLANYLRPGDGDEVEGKTMILTFIEARKVCESLDRLNEEDATNLSAVLRACLDAGEFANGIELAMNADRHEYESRFFARMLDGILTDLVPVIAKAAYGLDNLKYYVDEENQ